MFDHFMQECLLKTTCLSWNVSVCVCVCVCVFVYRQKKLPYCEHSQDWILHCNRRMVAYVEYKHI